MCGVGASKREREKGTLCCSLSGTLAPFSSTFPLHFRPVSSQSPLQLHRFTRAVILNRIRTQRNHLAWGEVMPAFPKREKASGAQAGGGQALINPLAEVISPKSAFGQKDLAAQGLLARAPAFASLERGDAKDAPRGKAKAGPAPASSPQIVRKEATVFAHRPRCGQKKEPGSATAIWKLRFLVEGNSCTEAPLGSSQGCAPAPPALAGPPRNPERFQQRRVLGLSRRAARGKDLRRRDRGSRVLGSPKSNEVRRGGELVADREKKSGSRNPLPGASRLIPRNGFFCRASGCWTSGRKFGFAQYTHLDLISFQVLYNVVNTE